MNITIKFCLFELVQVPNFNINWQFCFFFGPNLLKKGISGQNRQNKCHRWILHIGTIQGTKFQLKLTILNLRIKFALYQTMYVAFVGFRSNRAKIVAENYKTFLFAKNIQQCDQKFENFEWIKKNWRKRQFQDVLLKV